MPTNLGPAEILVILVVALIVLGPKRLPEAGKQVGKALAEVRRWSRGIQGEIRDAFDTAEEPPMVSTDQVTAEAAKTEAAPVAGEAAATTSGETKVADDDQGPSGPTERETQPASPETEVAAAATTPALPDPPKPEPPVVSNGSGPPDDPSRQ